MIPLDPLLSEAAMSSSSSSAAAETVMSAAEYSAAVATWLEQAYQWRMFAVGFPSYVAYQANRFAQQQGN
jgi:hypothetical protein